MPEFLIIETSTDICSVALCKDQNVIRSITVNDRNVHSSKLTLFVKQILKEADVSIKDIDAVSVNRGPGSFTGLRIGVSVAKGIAYGLDIPLISVSAFNALAYMARKQYESQDQLYCPMIDARNNEVYYTILEHDYKTVMEPDIGAVNFSTFENILENRQVVFFGDGAEKWTKPFVDNNNVKLISNILPDAESLISFTSEKFEMKDFENIMNFEPQYLRDFKAKAHSEKIRRILYS